MNRQQTDPAALRAAYRHYIKKFVDEIEDTHKLCVIYSFIQGLWLGKQRQREQKRTNSDSENKRP